MQPKTLQVGTSLPGDESGIATTFGTLCDSGAEANLVVSLIWSIGTSQLSDGFYSACR